MILCELCRNMRYHSGFRYIRVVKNIKKAPKYINVCKQCIEQKEFFYIADGGHVMFNIVTNSSLLGERLKITTPKEGTGEI